MGPCVGRASPSVICLRAAFLSTDFFKQTSKKKQCDEFDQTLSRLILVGKDALMGSDSVTVAKPEASGLWAKL